MSSIVTEELVLGRKLVVQIAENGHTVELDCDESTSVEAVQRYIEAVTGIQFNDQLLLYLDAKLEPQRQLSVYKLPREGQEVFLYNRARLHQDSPVPPPEEITIPELVIPTSPSSSQNPHPLDDAPDPALKALPSYERQFRYHFQRGHAIYGFTQAKIEVSEQLLRELRVQERALGTATDSMDHHYRMIYPTYMDFMKCYLRQHRYHGDLLVNFRRDVEKLRSCKLHPSLQTESRKCLLDFVKEENLRKWAENCGTSHKQFESKVQQLKTVFGELKRRVGDLNLTRASTSIAEVETTIKEHQRYLNEQKSIMQSLSKDVNTVKKLVDDCLSCQLSASLRPHDAVSALGPMYDVHDRSHLPKMEACDLAILNLLDFCKAKKNEMNLFVHNFMQKVAIVQSMVRDIRLQFPAYKEAMERLDDIFEDLKLVRGVGPAYRACLAEVASRKASTKLYMGLVGKLAERLAAKREAEARRREAFIKVQSLYIPRDILASMGLFDSPNHCDVNIAPFDTGLLDIDISELDLYAPESLLGGPAKSEKRGTPRSSFASSSSHLSESGETLTEPFDKCDVEELLDGCGSVEITGTSKLEVENAQLRAELASSIARLCSLSLEIDYTSLDDSRLENLLKSVTEKTEKALQLKDEYEKQLQSVLKMKQMQCLSYEKRIQELEHRLSDQYLQGQKVSSSKDVSDCTESTLRADDCKSEMFGDREGPTPSEPMDEASCISASLDPKLDQSIGSSSKVREGVDENMTDMPSASNQPNVDVSRYSMDASMHDPQRDELPGGDKAEKEKLVTPLDVLPSETAVDSGSVNKTCDELLVELETALANKSNQCTETVGNLKAAMEEVSNLRREVDVNRKLLDECQMNCAHLENCLHEAREEAHTNLCAADRRASEYSALRTSALKIRSLFERLRACVTAPSGVAGFANSIRALALSLASSANENEDDGTADIRACIRVLAEKVSFLSRQREELLERYSQAEAAQTHLTKELEEKKELVKSLYAKHQVERQANKEKISFGRFEVHELAAFVLNFAGHYEAINRNCSNYYLSEESVALFAENLPTRPKYIIGQIVHIERKTVRSQNSSQGDLVDILSSDPSTQLAAPGTGSMSNLYSLPVGCEYFIVTVAMLPDTIHSPSS
ncbi:autophagy-related protein 11-like [Aristolochia californica]|uniref:autophagy-related protein 11-like n=1 Tax=Aristolochia californica TaxID=171875 RepID=UPI0035E11369